MAKNSLMNRVKQKNFQQGGLNMAKANEQMDMMGFEPEEQGIDPVIFGLTDKDFELLAKNFARIRNQLKITNDLLDQYKEYYEPEKKDKKEKE